jgi:putative redox protein
MIETTIRYLNGVQFEVEARGHTLVCDQPREGGGDDAGMTPPELMLASLASCAGYYVVQYLKFRTLPLEGLTVRVEAEKAQQPARLGSFRILVDAPQITDPRHFTGIHRAAEKCLIHNTLLHSPSIAIEVVPSGCEQDRVAGSLVGQTAGGGQSGGLYAVR